MTPYVFKFLFRGMENHPVVRKYNLVPGKFYLCEIIKVPTLIRLEMKVFNGIPQEVN